MILNYFLYYFFRMNINDSINLIFKNVFTEYANKVSEECGIERSRLDDIWNSMCKDFTIEKPKRRNSLNKISAGNRCKALLQRGKRKGEECGKRCEKDYCKLHAKHIVEEKPPQQDKSEVEEKPKKIILRVNKELNVLWHPRTRFVFKSKTERIVVGKITDTDTQIDLEESDIDICKDWKFPYKLK